MSPPIASRPRATSRLCFAATLVAAGGALAYATLVSAEPDAPASATFSAEQRTEIGTIVRDYLLQNPEVLVDVSRELEKRQQEKQAATSLKVLTDNKATVYKSSADFVLGNPDGDVTVVEFFDYNCGYCKRAIGELIKLSKADPKVRIVLKETPIFGGESSVFAAKAAMAAKAQGKYLEFHLALMAERQVTPEVVLKVAERVGLDVTKLKADILSPDHDKTLKETIALAEQLGIEGTPGFLIDSTVNPGYVPAEVLQQIIGDVRKSGCKMC